MFMKYTLINFIVIVFSYTRIHLYRTQMASNAFETRNYTYNTITSAGEAVEEL